VISQVRGTLTHRGLDRVEVLTAAGVAYEILIPLNVLEKLPRDGGNILLHTALIVREDAWQLYGFSATPDRELFRLLLTASGVGPSLALSLLSSLSPHRLVSAIRGRDVAMLQRVPRVGKKTAERLCLELSDKLGAWGGEIEVPSGARGVSADAVRALVALGYSDADAERAVRAVRTALESSKDSGPADLIKRALGTLQGR
jgi:Holliday junction DNA helicase RuvA